MTTGNKRIPKHDDPVSPSKKLFTESSPAIGHLTKTCSGRTYLTDIVESSLLSVQQTRAAGSHTTKPQTAPELQMRSKLGFLDLPYEIRRLIYIELFSTQILELFSKDEDEDSSSILHTPCSFRPVQDVPSSYELLLTNSHCFNEGIKLYYQHCTVLHANCIPEWQIKMEPGISQRTHSEEQRFTEKCKCKRQCKDIEVIFARGLTSNALSIVEATRRIVSENRRMYIDRLTYFKSLQEVIVKLPRMEWDHWPELQEIILPNTRPSDDQLRYYHEGVLPTHEPVKRFIKGLRQRTHIGSQETKEQELVTVMQSMPQVAFRARMPVTYKYDDKQVWEVSSRALMSDLWIRLG